MANKLLGWGIVKTEVGTAVWFRRVSGCRTMFVSRASCGRLSSLVSVDPWVRWLPFRCDVPGVGVWSGFLAPGSVVEVRPGEWRANFDGVLAVGRDLPMVGRVWLMPDGDVLVNESVCGAPFSAQK